MSNNISLNKVKNSTFLANKAYDNKTKLNKEAEKNGGTIKIQSK